ncbi:hypothetical protein D4768_17290 [Rhodococcus erythropolis]|uniref:hypothetical protein n=1 Tax=Rhodococcus erythropolis TaxID=1833 RepID=UPI001F3E45A1|nr:hypothetical protein [Rhodococcus erythropolis]UJC79251.1 hypothetical protein D4768_17290 [Rhodococcus erythropolis]
MSILLVAAQTPAPDSTDLAAYLLAAMGYLSSTAALARGWKASDVQDMDYSEAHLEKERLRELRNQHLGEHRDPQHNREDSLADLVREERAIEQATNRAIRINARSVANLTMLSDLMLILMVLGVVGAAVCAIASMWIATPVVAGVVPTAWIASSRLSSATTKRQNVLDNLQKQRREHDRETVTLDRAKLELAVEEREYQLRAIEREKNQAEREKVQAEREKVQVNIRKYELEQELNRIRAQTADSEGPPDGQQSQPEPVQ